MNISLPSIVDLEKDKKLRQKKFIQNQSQFNGQIKSTHLNNNYYVKAQQVIGLSKRNIPSPGKIRFKDQNNIDSRIQGKILEQQLKLKFLQNEYDLEKSRIQDENNAKTYRIKYPYGKQNVKITEDVLQKYSTNQYLNQSQMLKKFEQDAKKLKQQKSHQRSCKKIQFHPNYDQSYPNYDRSIKRFKRTNKKKASVLESQLSKFQLYKQKHLQQIKSQKNRIQYENQNLKLQKLQLLVKNIKKNLKIPNLSPNQTSKRPSNQSSNQQQKFLLSLQQSRSRLKKINFYDMQQKLKRNQIPIVIYNNKDHKRKNFILQNINNDISTISVNPSIQRSQQYHQINKILNLNKKRLDNLTYRY